MPLFSVIVPVYNVEEYLEKCVQSVLSQSFGDFELLLIDDGSTDSSLSICRAFSEKDLRVKTYFFENSGASGARNAGLDIACGDYVVFLDSDDFWNGDNLLALLAEKIGFDFPDAVLFGCTDWNMNTGQSVVSRTGFDDKALSSGRDEAMCYLLSKKLIPGGVYVFCSKRKVIEENKIRFKRGIQDEDYDYVLSVFSKCEKISAINEPLYTYRQGRGGSVTKSSSVALIRGIAYTLEKWLPAAFNIQNESLKKEYLNYLAFIYSTGFVFCGRMEKSQRAEALSIMKKHKGVLKFGYWKKTRLARLLISVFGMNLFSLAAAKYFNKTHV